MCIRDRAWPSDKTDLEVQALIQRCDTIIQQLVSAEELEKTNYLKFYNRALEISIQAELNEKKKQY